MSGIREHQLRKLTTAGIVLITTALTAPARAQFGPENAAMGVLDEFMAALKERLEAIGPDEPLD